MANTSRYTGRPPPCSLGESKKESRRGQGPFHCDRSRRTSQLTTGQWSVVRRAAVSTEPARETRARGGVSRPAPGALVSFLRGSLVKSGQGVAIIRGETRD